MKFDVFHGLATIVSCQEKDGVASAHVSVASPEALSGVLEASSRAGFCVIPGPPRPLRRTHVSRPAVFVDPGTLNKVLEYSGEDQVIGVESGMTLKELNALVSQKNQWWPVYAGSPESTVAEIIMDTDGGCLEHRFGGPRDLVLGMTVALSSGDVIKCGGRVVKNVSGYDLRKLFIGSRGWLGIVCSSYLRLFALPQSSQSRLWKSNNSLALWTASTALLKSGLPLSCLELVDGRVLLSLAEEYPDISRLLATAGVANESLVLLTQAHGHPHVVDAVLAEAEKVATAHLGQGMLLPESQAHDLWLKLSDVRASLSYSCVDVAITLRQMEALLNWLGPERPMWQARPGAGRAKLYLRDESFVSDLLASLTVFTQTHGQSFVVGYSDQEFSYRSESIPKPQTAYDLLKKAIKERYDPSGCLNPLVKL